MLGITSGSSIEDLSWITWDAVLSEAGVDKSAAGISQ